MSATMDADRISQLPQSIILQILSFLPSKEAVRVCVLSKAWLGFFACFPMSDFCESFLGRTNEVQDRMLGFANFVYYSLRRQSLQYGCIPKFKLSLTGDDGWISPKGMQVADLLDRSIQLSMQYGVEELSLNIYFSSNRYGLPKALFSSKELSYTSINYPSLREFSLEGVRVYDQSSFENLSFTCPSIEKFALIKCSGLECLRLSGFTKLKKVKVINGPEYRVNRIEIDGRSLQSFSYRAVDDERIFRDADEVTAHIDLSSCKNLEVLKLRDFSVTDRIIQDLDSKFPTLKVLVLQKFHIGRIQISFPRLEKLVIDPAVEAVINAPRLQFFKCALRDTPPSLSLSKARLNKVSLKLLPPSLVLGCFRDFIKDLREYLGNFNGINLVTLCLSHLETRFVHKGIISNPVLLDIKHLKLKFDLSKLFNYGISNRYCEIEMQCQSLVDYLSCVCHPESLLVVCGQGSNDALLCTKVFCKKLVESWPQDLKGIEIEHFGRHGGTKILTAAALLDFLPTLVPKDKIRFVFESWFKYKHQ